MNLGATICAKLTSFIGKPFFFSEGEDAELIVKKHIALLHLYNETKDATQVCVLRVFSSRND
jgi:hypothetical protein